MICKECGRELKKKYYATNGLQLLLITPPTFLLLMFISYGTAIPYLFVFITILLAIYFFFKKKGIIIFAKNAKKIQFKPATYLCSNQSSFASIRKFRGTCYTPLVNT